jgi:predicted MFS family arabinose efflux permease
MALSVAMTGPPLVGAIAAPIIGEVIDSEGWRAGYRVLSLVSVLGGMMAVFLIKARKRNAQVEAPKPKHAPLTRKQFLAIARQPAFPLLVGGMFLINFPQVIVSSQMKLVLYESGAASTFATWLLSLYAISVIVGRFICGYALDRVAPHLVAVIALGMPAIGLFALASPYDASWVLIGAIALTGLAQGAEGDVGAMLTSRKFALQHYSFIYSFVVAAMGAATAIGSLVLSFMLHQTDSYSGFLVLAGLVTLLGVACFHFIGRYGAARPEPGVPVPQSA